MSVWTGRGSGLRGGPGWAEMRVELAKRLYRCSDSRCGRRSCVGAAVWFALGEAAMLKSIRVPAIVLGW